MAKMKFDLSSLARHRKRLGLSQQVFWSELGVTQGAGSRYERSSVLPKPVALLLTLRETEKVTSAQLAEAAAYIKKAGAKKQSSK